jgi:hypothetical protein
MRCSVSRHRRRVQDYYSWRVSPEPFVSDDLARAQPGFDVRVGVLGEELRVTLLDGFALADRRPLLLTELGIVSSNP